MPKGFHCSVCKAASQPHGANANPQSSSGSLALQKSAGPAARHSMQAGPGPGCGLQSPAALMPGGACLTIAQSPGALAKGGAGSLTSTKEVTAATRPPVGRGLRGVARGRAWWWYRLGSPASSQAPDTRVKPKAGTSQLSCLLHYDCVLLDLYVCLFFLAS